MASGRLKAGMAIGAAMALAIGCSSSGSGGGGGGGEGGGGDSFDRNALLSNLANNVILPTYVEFVVASHQLATATSAWAQAIGDGTAERQAAQDAWKQAIRVWQRAEVMSVGPAGSSLVRVGGQDYRDEIYSWPTTNACLIDQKTASQAFSNANFFADELVNVYGLDALEYLLFRPDAANACPPQVAINAQGTWAALSEADVWKRRAAYSAAVAGQVATVAVQLRDAWAPEKGDFAGKLANAGKAGSPYSNAQAALDEVFAAMWYVEREVKDFKLGDPLGLTSKCPTESCPNLLESQWSGTALNHVKENLEAFRMLYLGRGPSSEDGVGFDDWLRARGADELASRMAQGADAAIAAIETLGMPLHEAIATDLAKAREVYVPLQSLMTDLKTQFVGVLGIRVPQEGAGDND